MDKSIFGEYTQIDFDKYNCLEDVEDVLDKIFTNNPNFWDNGQLYYRTGTGDGFELVRYILEDKIKVYEYKYDIPENPKEDNDRDMLFFNTYYGWSKAKYYDLALIFWWANSFLNKNGYSLINFGSSTYRNLQIVKNNYDEFDFNYKINNDHSLHEFLRNPNNFISLDEHISVYWGKMEANQIISDITRGTKYSMVFPYVIEDTDKLSCYLLEVNDDLINEYKEKIKRNYERFIKNKKVL